MNLPTVHLIYHDNIHMRIHADASIMRELYDHYSFYVDGYRHMPKFKAKLWDGKIHLVNLMTSKVYCGLAQDIKDYCDERGYAVSMDGFPASSSSYSREFVESLVGRLGMPSAMTPRPYQIDAVHHVLEARRGVLLMATGSGKSAVIYMCTRLLEVLGKRSLIIVPTLGLVNQMESDFADYSVENGWNSFYKIHAGISKTGITTNVVCTTWQSIYKMPAEWFAQFGAVFADEVHMYEATSMKGIMEKCDVPYRIGCTGTLADSKSNEISLTGLFGPINTYASTADLIEAGYLSRFRVKAITLKHHDSTNTAYKEYIDQLKGMADIESRNDFIIKLAASTTGNTVILFKHVGKHANLVYKKMKSMEHEMGKKVLLYTGNVDKNEREKIRKSISDMDNAVLIASYQSFSLGTNAPSLRNCILSVPPKSKIATLQSLGRILRVADNKDEALLFDIVDDISYRKDNSSSSLDHFQHRYEIYAKEGFDVELIEYDLVY